MMIIFTLFFVQTGFFLIVNIQVQFLDTCIDTVLSVTNQFVSDTKCSLVNCDYLYLYNTLEIVCVHKFEHIFYLYYKYYR